ncbi:MAG: hypothetical protein O2975_03770, partial [Proteobacteria bacterium]|nr:hypothetical protein [Pseudomonadota bacterium]
MNVPRLFRTLLAAALLALPLAAQSAFDPVDDDTDIFLANPSFNATRPNVLIFVDNTANWNTAFATEKAALVSVLNGLTDAYNVGIGMFVETGNPNDNVDGAYIRFGIRQMTATNKTALSGMVNALDQTGDKGNNATMSLAMGEMYRYFAGAASSSGFGKVKRDYAGNTVNNSAAASLPGNPFTSAASTTYVSPIADGCQKNFIIVISNGSFGDNSSSLATAQAHLSSLTGVSPPTTITIAPNGAQGNWSDEYANFMANSDCNPGIDGVQNVYTYALDVLPVTTGQGPNHTALMKSMAGVGKGKYYAITDTSSTTQLENALTSIFTEVQAVNSVFASTTLPVSVNVRGTNLNQVYIGVFRPSSTKSPRWLGNLKLYKLGVNTSTQTLFLADADGAAAENTSTGFISGSAKSFWTTNSTYWGFRDASQNGVGASSDAPDGDLVEKGGAAQQVRIKYPSSQATRNLYTCTNGTGLCAPGASLSGTLFATSNADVSGPALNAFTKYNVATLAVTSGTTVTLTLGAAPSPVWNVGDAIVISGASPNAFNGTFTLLSADNTTFTYTFDIGTAPGGDTARATAASHGLQSGDFVTVTGAAPAAFNVTDANVTRVS